VFVLPPPIVEQTPVAQFLKPPDIVENAPALQQVIVPVKSPVVPFNVPPDELCPIPPPIVTPLEQHSLVGDCIIFL
jgi:hypothetical protein